MHNIRNKFNTIYRLLVIFIIINVIFSTQAIAKVFYVGQDGESNTIRLVYNGSINAQFSVDSNGIVSIVPNTGDTTKIDSNLHLGDGNEIRFYDDNGSNYAGFSASSSLSSDIIWSLPTADGTDGQVLSTRGDGRLYWAAGGYWTQTGSDIYYTVGNVGIGTTTASYPLSVIGDINYTGDLRLDGEVAVFGDESYGSSASSSDNVVWVDDAGNVGIGTTSPNYALDVIGITNAGGGFIVETRESDPASSTEGRIWLRSDLEYNASILDVTISDGGTGTSTAPSYGQVLVGNTNSEYELVSTSSLRSLIGLDESYLYINSSGNVGIGTTNPTELLHIDASGGQFLFDGAGGIDLYQELDAVTAGGQIRAYSDGGATKTNIASIMMFQTNASDDIGDIRFHTHNGTTLAEKVRIKGDGNVGIGATSPGTKLDVRGNFRTYGTLANSVIKSTVVDGAARSIYMVGPDNSSQQYGKIAMEGTSHPITFWVGNPATEKMRIQSDGNVGVGATDPQSNFVVDTDMGSSASTKWPVHIFGSGTYNADTDYQVGLKFKMKTYNEAASDYEVRRWSGISGKSFSGWGSGVGLSFWTQEGWNGEPEERMVIDSAGEVGIGTTNPSRNLHVVSSGDTIVQSESTATDGSAYFIAKNDARQWSVKVDGTADSFFIRDDNASGGGISERFVITTGGNVGLGNTAPGAKLQLGNGATGGDLILTGTGSTNDYKLTTKTSNDLEINVTSGANRYMNLLNTNGSYGLGLTTDGNVGIGNTATAAQLHIKSPSSAIDWLRLEADSGSGYVNFRNDGSRSPYVTMIDNGGTNRIQLNATETGKSFFNGGNLGVGNANPMQRLNITNYPESYNSDAQASIKIEDEDDSIGLKIGADDSNAIGYIQAYDEGSTYNKNLALQAQGGNVGIGTISPSKLLYVNGSAGGTQAWNASDMRYKENIVTIGSALNRINKIRGVQYEWKDGDSEELNGFDDKSHYGVIAQEVESEFPELVDHLGETEEMKHVEYNGLVGILIEAVKELKVEKDKEIKELKEQIEALKDIINNESL